MQLLLPPVHPTDGQVSSQERHEPRASGGVKLRPTALLLTRFYLFSLLALLACVFLGKLVRLVIKAEPIA
jgi:hypothetical protein